MVTVVPGVSVFVFAPTTEEEIVAETLILCPLYPLPRLIANVLPVGDPPSVKSLAVDNDMTSPTAPVLPEPVVIIETE